MIEVKIKYEILLLLDWGFKPREIIKMGYNEKTVYKFSSVHKEALALALEKLDLNQTKLIRKMKTLWLELLRKKQE